MEPANQPRELLIRAAAEFIGARSYAETHVSAICDRAGVAEATFYAHFPSKRDLVLATLDWLWAAGRAYLLEPAFTPDLPPTARLERYLRASYAANQAATIENGCFLGCPFGNLVAELGASDPVIREHVRGIFGQWSGYFERALAEAIATGELPPHDVKLAAKALLAYIQGVMLMATADNDAGTVATLGMPALQIIGLPFEHLARQAATGP